jgi:hypothetical protein
VTIQSPPHFIPNDVNFPEPENDPALLFDPNSLAGFVIDFF